MAKKVVDFLKTLAVKAGANIEDEKLKTIFAALNIDVELPEDLVTAIDNGLLSLAVAKNNHPEIKNHYFAQAYKGIDSEIDRTVVDEKLPEDVVAELKAETSSTKRAILLARKLKELETKKAAAGSSEKAQLNQQILDLNNQLRAEKESINAVRAEHAKEIAGVKKSYALQNLLTQYKTIHDELDPSTKNIILNAVIEKNLAAKKGNFGVDDAGNLILTGEGGTNLFSDDNRLLTAKAFLDKVLADEKLLKVTDNNQNNNSNNNQNNNHNSNGGNNRNNFNNNGGNNNRNNQNQNGNNGNNNQRKQSGVLQELIQNAQNDLNNSNNNIF